MSFDLREWQVIPGNWNRLNEILGLLGSQEIPGLVVTASGVLSRNTDVTSSSFGDITLNYDATQFDESPAGTLHIQHFHTLATESTFVGVDTEDGGANYDTHVGYQAGKANAAAHNIFIGAEVAKDNVEGFANTAIGNYNMLNASGPVTRNTAIGYYNQLNLLSYNNYSSASGNTSIGAFCASNAKTALFNEAIGYYALYTNRYGHGNCATGYRTLYKLDAIERVITAFADAGGGNTTVTVDDTTGLSNGVNIRITGTTNYDGPYTVANFVGSTFDIVKAFVADDAMGYITIMWEASANVAMGGDTGYNTTTGAQNVYMGFECAYSNQTGMRNIFIGYQAGYNEMGSDKLYIENSDSVNPLIYGEFDNDLVNINGQLNVISTSTPQFTLTNGATTATFALDAGGDLTIAASGGDISFGNENLTTTGDITAETINTNNIISIGTELDIRTTSISFDNTLVDVDLVDGNLITTGQGIFGNLDVDTLNLNGNVISDSTGTISFADDHVTTTGDITASHYNNLKIDLTGTRNIFLGETSAGDSITSGTDNICMGTAAGNALTSGVENFFFGYNAGLVTTTGGYNFGLGVAAGAYITGGSFNTGVGRTSIYGVGNGSGNVGIGYKALWGVAGNNPNYNTVIGSFAFGGTNTSKSGSENTILGYRAGNLLVSGSGNVFLGYMAGGQELGSNKLYIDNSNTTTPLIYGEFDNNLVRIGGHLELIDNNKIKLGTGKDVEIYYDNANLVIDSSIIAASDLNIQCGTDKTLELQETVWKDINIGGVNLARPAASQPDEDEFVDEGGSDTGITTLAFAVGEKASSSLEMQHDYKEGTNFVVHVHWQGIAAPTGTDNVQWRLTYVLARDGTTLDSATIVDSPDTVFDTQYECKRTDIVTIDGSTAGVNGGAVLIGDQLLFTLERVAATGDAYAGDALIATVGIHYEIDTLGSRQILIK